MKIDWDKIRNEYITTGISQRELAKKFGVSHNTLMKIANKEKWNEQRARLKEKTELKTSDKLSDKLSDMAVKLNEIDVIALNKISEMISKAADPKDIKTLTSALKDITEIEGLTASHRLKERESSAKEKQDISGNSIADTITEAYKTRIENENG